jgi:hypothetical protein
MAARDKSNVVRFSPKRSLVKIGLSESRFDNFLSGCRIVFSFGDAVVYEPRSQDAEISEVWGSVGNFIAEAMQGAAGSDPALPGLPEDLFSAPVSGVVINEQERSSAPEGHVPIVVS